MAWHGMVGMAWHGMTWRELGAPRHTEARKVWRTHASGLNSLMIFHHTRNRKFCMQRTPPEAPHPTEVGKINAGINSELILPLILKLIAENQYWN